MSATYENEACSSGTNSLKHTKESRHLFRRNQRRLVIGFSVFAAVCFVLLISALVISILIVARPQQSADSSEIQGLKKDLNQVKDVNERLEEKLDSEIAKVKTLIRETGWKINSYHKQGWFFKTLLQVATFCQKKPMKRTDKSLLKRCIKTHKGRFFSASEESKKVLPQQ